MSESLESSSIHPKIPIILASGSESRKQMLLEAGIIFEAIVSDTDEDKMRKRFCYIIRSNILILLSLFDQFVDTTFISSNIVDN